MDFYRPPTNQGTTEALGNVYRALRAWMFYPKGHPTRRSSMKQAHSVMQELLDGNALSLACSRSGFSFADGEKISDPTGHSILLSSELFIRRVKRITFLQDLLQEDLLDFLKIITLPPETIQKMGGIDRIMTEHGIRSIWTNQYDLAEISIRRLQVEASGVKPPTLDESETCEDSAASAEQPTPQTEECPPEMQLQALLGRIATATDDDVYARLLKQALSCAEQLKLQLDFASLFPLLELLSSHLADQKRSPAMRNADLFALELLVNGNDFLRFIFGRIEQSGSLTSCALQAVLAAGGVPAATLAIEQMGQTGSQTARRTLADMLSKLGEQAVPTLLEALNDKRWYVVRNICVILGNIASSDAMPGLLTCLQHKDIRVCKEAIRSLARTGGNEAETALIGILKGNDRELYPQTITSLGSIKSRKALTELMRIVCANDLFLKSFQLKVEALSAIAMIGDRQVIPRLAELLTERHMLAPARWNQFKLSIVQCLGRLGDVRALPTLNRFSTSSSELGAACREAIELIEHSGGRPDGHN